VLHGNKNIARHQERGSAPRTWLGTKNARTNGIGVKDRSNRSVY
jgi:hypothetical protein